MTFCTCSVFVVPHLQFLCLSLLVLWSRCIIPFNLVPTQFSSCTLSLMVIYSEYSPLFSTPPWLFYWPSDMYFPLIWSWEWSHERGLITDLSPSSAVLNHPMDAAATRYKVTCVCYTLVYNGIKVHLTLDWKSFILNEWFSSSHLRCYSLIFIHQTNLIVLLTFAYIVYLKCQEYETLLAESRNIKLFWS